MSGLEPAAADERARHAALVLHALHPGDRQWVLDSVQADERAALEAMLEELDSLGIPPDPDGLPQLLAGGAARTAETLPEPGRIVPGARLGRRDRDRLVALLREEPVALVQHLLDSQAWPWREPVARRLQLPAIATAAAPAPPLLRAAICEATWHELALATKPLPWWRLLQPPCLSASVVKASAKNSSAGSLHDAV